MKIFLKIILWTFWLILGFILHGAFISYFDDKDTRAGFLVFLVLWWGITIIIISALVKWKQYRKLHPALTKEQKQNIKQIKEKEKYRKSAEYKQKYLSEVEIENSYFGKGVLLKNLENPDDICFTDIKSGFDRIFDSFGKKSDDSCDFYEFIVKEDNINYVLTSLEKIYKKSAHIMEECYDKMYKDIVEFFEENCGERLKNEFNLDYLKENWYVKGLAIYDDHIEFSIGIDAAENHEHDNYYDIYICVDFSTQEAEVTFNVVW
jgi:hypothetical protein